jgi:hypothetical protein
MKDMGDMPMGDSEMKMENMEMKGK